MKRILLLFFLAISFFANAQVFQENFNSGIPSTWIVTDNGISQGSSWIAMPIGVNSSTGIMVAPQTGTAANPVQDWIITPAVSLVGVTNPQLVFQGKTTPPGPNSNTVLKIMVSTTGTNIADFQMLTSFTESFSGATNPISPNANYSLKTVNLTGYANQTVYVAFVMESVSSTNKSWNIDDVAFFNQCVDVTNVHVNNLTLTSGIVSWDNPGGATSFEIEVVTGTNQPTGVPTNTSTTNSIPLSFVAGTNYKVYVRAVCSGNTSAWVSTSQFTPLVPGTNCSSAMNITSLPYTHSDTTANYGDDYNASPGTNCGITGNYLSGDDVVYAFTPNENMIVNIEMIPQGTYSGVFVYDSCANIGVSCVAGVADANATVRHINELSLSAGVTYYIVISTRTSPQSVQYTLNIQRVFCSQPVNLTATNFTQTSAQLGFQNGIGNNGTSWQIFVQNLGGTLPTTPGTTVTSSTPVVTQTQNGIALTPSTIYQYYVRSVCADGNFSPWSGPYIFNTLCAPFNLPFSEGFNSSSLTEICWKVINNNNDIRFWELNYATTPFEGDQSASINALGSGTATNDDYLVSPVFNFNGQYRLRYKYKVGSNTSPQNFSVKMSQNGGTGINDFTTFLLADAAYNNNVYKEKIVYLPNFVGTGAISWHVSTNMASRIFIDDVIVEAIPSCPEPYDVVSTSVTSNSITLDWQQFGNVNSWDIVLVPTGTPFTGNTTGLTVYNTTTKPHTIQGLPAGVMFDAYVKSNCSTTSESVWSIFETVSTIVSNDECVDAIQIPVNQGVECIDSVYGSLIGGTNSNLGTVCSGTTHNDVWFQFTATATTHILNLNNLVGDVTTVYAVLYSGDCQGTLTRLECDTFNTFTDTNTYNGLTPGTTYYIKFYTNSAPVTTRFDVCLLTPPQPILVTKNQYTVPQLVTDILINNPCANVTNVTWSTGSNANGELGIGYFEKNNSTFGYNDGIILSTGDVLQAPGPKGTNTQGASATGWGGDADLSAVLATQGITGGLHNATVLEFDFTAITNQMSFNFLFASEEYGVYQCNYSDVFAFLLTDLTTGITTNIAVIPGTTIPVSVTTIRDGQFYAGGGVNCGSANVQYFGAFYNGTDAASIGAPINFKGQTVSMIAESMVTPGTTYHIKLAIADYSDSGVDSAVFIEGGSFQLGHVDLGADLTVEENTALCSEQSYTLDSGVDMDQYTVEWFKDGVLIPGENGPVLIVTESGTYTIEATYIGSECAISDSVVVEIFPLFIHDFNDPELLKVCSNTDRILDLTYNEAVMLNGISASNFIFEYYPTSFDLENNTNEITNPQAYLVNNSQQIFVKITNQISGCVEKVSFEVKYFEVSEPQIIEDVSICTSFLLPDLPDDQKYFTGPNGTGENLKENSYIGVGTHKIYVLSTNDICSEEDFFTVEVLNCSIPKGISPNGDGLNDNLDLSFFNVSKIEIFNRYGAEVYSHGSGYTNQWHGQNNKGEKLPSGTYFYNVVTPLESFTGWIQVVHESN